MQDGPKAVWSIPYVSVAFFPSLKQNFIAYRSSKVSSHPDCIFEIDQLWQSGFSSVYSNCYCSCPFEPEIIKIGQSSHKMYSNNIVNFQESTTILNACTKSLETYWMHHVVSPASIILFITIVRWFLPVTIVHRQPNVFRCHISSSQHVYGGNWKVLGYYTYVWLILLVKMEHENFKQRLGIGFCEGVFSPKGYSFSLTLFLVHVTISWSQKSKLCSVVAIWNLLET